MRFNQIPSNAGLGLEMKVIAAVVVGGAAIRGGRGHVAGTLLGVVLLGAIGPALTFLGVSAYWERAIQGAIILAAVAIDAVRRASRASRARRVRPRRAGLMPRALASARFPNGEWVLLLALAVEVALFAAIAQNFVTRRQLLRGRCGSASSSGCSRSR